MIYSYNVLKLKKNLLTNQHSAFAFMTITSLIPSTFFYIFHLFFRMFFNGIRSSLHCTDDIEVNSISPYRTSVWCDDIELPNNNYSYLIKDCYSNLLVIIHAGDVK